MEKLKNNEDLAMLVVMRDYYAEEYGRPLYMAFNDRMQYIDKSAYDCASSSNWFFSDKERLKNVGQGNTVQEAIDDLKRKLNGEQD